MNTIRSWARAWTFLAAVWFLGWGIMVLFEVAVLSPFLALLAIVIGVLLFFVS